jgi:hypothetical protein
MANATAVQAIGNHFQRIWRLPLGVVDCWAMGSYVCLMQGDGAWLIVGAGLIRDKASYISEQIACMSYQANRRS